VFSVVVDGSNNKLDDIKNGVLNITVSFFPSRPAETVVITVGQQDSAATALEA
jgi:uncharacterized protein